MKGIKVQDQVRSYQNLYQDSICLTRAHERQRYGSPKGLEKTRTKGRATYVNMMSQQQTAMMQQHQQQQYQQQQQHQQQIMDRVDEQDAQENNVQNRADEEPEQKQSSMDQ